jgi:uncharacterized membrane protein YqhA
MQRDKIESTMSRLRYFSFIAVVASGLGSVLMFIIGAVKTARAYISYFPAGFTEQAGASTNVAIAYLIQAIDAFLIGLVLMIFSGGIYNLFIHRLDSGKAEINSWIKITNISQLKRILAELVILVLFVKFLEIALKNALETYSWEMLVLPLGIVLLALALKLIDLEKAE